MPIANVSLEDLNDIVSAYNEISNRKKKTKTDKVLLKFIEIYISSVTSFSIKDLKVLLNIYMDKNTSSLLKDELKGIIFNLKTARNILEDWEKQKDINKPYFYDLPSISSLFIPSFPSKTDDPISPYYQIVSTTIEPYYKEVKGKKDK